MSENDNSANDYALAKLLNERVINIFTMVVDNRNTPDFTAVNRSYILMADELKRIYDRQPELKKIGTPICWRVLENLEQAHEVVLSIEFTHKANDYGNEHNSNVSTLCYRANIDEPALSPQIENLLSEADKNIATFKTELDKMYARLSFESFSVPVVTIGDKKYHFPSTMRDGIALTVITYCLDKHPNEQLALETLKSELKEASIPAQGLNNFRERIRKTVFGENKPLSPFVKVYPRAILVRKTTELSNEQLDAIKLAGS